MGEGSEDLGRDRVELEGGSLIIPIVIAYEHRYRRVDVERIWQSKEGNWLLTGRDYDREGEYRSFRVDRIKGKIHFLKRKVVSVE